MALDQSDVEIKADEGSVDRFIQEKRDYFNENLIGQTYSPKARAWELAEEYLRELAEKIKNKKIKL